MELQGNAEKVTGGCFCGAVRYQAEVYLDDTYYCHCRICQKVTGAPAEMPAEKALSHSDIADLLSRASGRSIVYEDITPESYGEEKAAQGWPVGSIKAVLALFAEIRAGNESAVSKTVEAVLGRKPINFQKFAADYASEFTSDT